MGGAAPRPGEPGGLGARGSALRPRAGRLRGGAHGGAERPRRRGGEPVTVAAISAGEKVSEEEEFARILTARSIRAEEGREREFDGRGEAPATAMAADGGAGADSA